MKTRMIGWAMLATACVVVLPILASGSDSRIQRVRLPGEIFTQVWKIEQREGRDWRWCNLFVHHRLCPQDRGFDDEEEPCLPPMIDLRDFSRVQNSARRCCKAPGDQK